jgi:cytochrome c553
MERKIFWVTLSAAALAAIAPSASVAQSSERSRDVDAKIAYCKKCHQQNGQGLAAAYPVPRLAGQTVPYLEAKFGIIGEHKRDNPTAEQFMAPAIGSVDPIIRKEVATYFSMLQPPPAGGGEQQRVSEGRKLYETGVAGKSCASCHGDDARGAGLTPRLAGQIYPYLLKVLTSWHQINKEHDGVKAGAEHDLTKDQIVAVASYLSNHK